MQHRHYEVDTELPWHNGNGLRILRFLVSGNEVHDAK